MAQNTPTSTDAGSTLMVPPYFIEHGNGVADQHHSITSHHEHRDISFEELRAKDYSCDRGIKRRSSRNASFLPRPGLVQTSMPLNMAPFSSGLKQSDLAHGSNPYNCRIILCRVGIEEVRDFSIHENLLTANSEYARTALKKEWNETQESILSFPEDDSNSFDVYQQWLYTGRIYLNRISNPLKGPNHYERLVRAYILGEKLIDCNFNFIIARLRLAY